MKYLLPILLSFFALHVSGQPEELSDAQKAAKAIDEGVLVVRLFWEEDRLDYLETNGTQEEYDEVAEEIQSYNQEIMDAFVDNYTFGDVVFMNAKDSQKLVDGEWEGILSDNKGNPLEIETTSYLVADFSSSKNLRLEGLNIWEWDGAHWVAPASPFPSFVSKYGFMGFTTRTPSEIVKRWNDQLLGK